MASITDILNYVTPSSDPTTFVSNDILDQVATADGGLVSLATQVQSARVNIAIPNQQLSAINTNNPTVAAIFGRWQNATSAQQQQYMIVAAIVAYILWG